MRICDNPGRGGVVGAWAQGRGSGSGPGVGGPGSGGSGVRGPGPGAGGPGSGAQVGGGGSEVRGPGAQGPRAGPPTNLSVESPVLRAPFPSVINTAILVVTLRCSTRILRSPSVHHCRPFFSKPSCRRSPVINDIHIICTPRGLYPILK